MDVLLIGLLIATLVFAATSFFKVDQQSAAIIERFGKFLRTAGPGLHFRIPLIDFIHG